MAGGLSLSVDGTLELGDLLASGSCLELPVIERLNEAVCMGFC